jgi:hypothetical protein
MLKTGQQELTQYKPHLISNNNDDHRRAPDDLLVRVGIVHGQSTQWTRFVQLTDLALGRPRACVF